MSRELQNVSSIWLKYCIKSYASYTIENYRTEYRIFSKKYRYRVPRYFLRTECSPLYIFNA